MYRDRDKYYEDFKNLKRKIKGTYERYTQDGNASLIDVAKCFNVQIDESRLEDYYIKRIGFDTLSIEILDKKNNISYASNYDSYAKLLQHSGNCSLYNNLLIVSPDYEREGLYNGETNSPIVEKVTFRNGDYKLEFMREYPYNIGLFENDGIQFSIKYSQKIMNDYQQDLLTRIYKDKDCTNSCEQLFTYGFKNFVDINDSQNRYIYVLNNDVICGVEVRSKKCHYSLGGACFEKTDINSDNYLPLKLFGDNQLDFDKEKSTSAMIFSGSADSCHHSIIINKIGSNAHIFYYAGKNDDKSEELVIPLLNSDKISNNDLQMIITELQTKYSDDKFISLVAKELMLFGNKIDIKNGLVKEELDVLNPRLFIKKSFDEIVKLVSENKENLFNLVLEQFIIATSFSNSDDDKKRKLKSNNS